MAPAPTLAERLAAAPSDSLSVADIASATGLTEKTVRRLTKDPQWPASSVPEDAGEQRFARTACVQWMRDHQAARVDVTELPGADSDRVTITDIAHRTGIGRGSISPLPAKYKDSNDPFPEADVLGTYTWGEVKTWLSRRHHRSGPRGAVEPPAPVKQPTTTPTSDVLTTTAIERLTGRGKEAVKTLVRRPEIADLSSGKVGRSRVWPAAALLPVLWRLGYLPESGPLSPEQTAVLVELGYLPAKGRPTPEQAAVLLEFGYDPAGSVEHRAWLVGPVRSATELAAHYGVTLSAVSRRLSRARDAGELVPTPIETEDGTRYDPKEFDTFWRR
ncbi:hypothetical protein AB0O91_05725 [Kitasatospora sp. NPDC089797]|uniref:hypothetical protein n=1 Tax=Kitasatospora sp. NPDC089797 TaxID=3155298 RepID=UPI003436CFBA